MKTGNQRIRSAEAERMKLLVNISYGPIFITITEVH